MSPRIAAGPAVAEQQLDQALVAYLGARCRFEQPFAQRFCAGLGQPPPGLPRRGVGGRLVYLPDIAMS
jgi:hypothetical protein